MRPSRSTTCVVSALAPIETQRHDSHAWSGARSNELRHPLASSAIHQALVRVTTAAF
jgi:hypothetical protein